MGDFGAYRWTWRRQASALEAISRSMVLESPKQTIGPTHKGQGREDPRQVGNPICELRIASDCRNRLQHFNRTAQNRQPGDHRQASLCDPTNTQNAEREEAGEMLELVFRE